MYTAPFLGHALGGPSDFLVPHECWLALGKDKLERLSNYKDLVNESLNSEQLTVIRYGLEKGLPTGNDRFKKQIEEALSILFLIHI